MKTEARPVERILWAGFVGGTAAPGDYASAVAGPWGHEPRFSHIILPKPVVSHYTLHEILVDGVPQLSGQNRKARPNKTDSEQRLDFDPPLDAVPIGKMIVLQLKRTSLVGPAPAMRAAMIAVI